jgi:hypothetical protein
MYKVEFHSDRERESRSPEVLQQPDYLESILNNVALATTTIRRLRASTRRDQLHLYIQETPNGDISLLDYWRSIKKD